MKFRKFIKIFAQSLNMDNSHEKWKKNYPYFSNQAIFLINSLIGDRFTGGGVMG